MIKNNSFDSSFWPPNSADKVLNYHLGLQTLFDRLACSVSENITIATFLQKRIEVETAITQLLSSTLDSPKATALEQMENAPNTSLKSAFYTICQESTEAIHCHKLRTNLLTQEVLEPLLDFTHEFDQMISLAKTELKEQISEFEHEAQSAQMTQSVYWSRCKALMNACPQFKRSNRLDHQFLPTLKSLQDHGIGLSKEQIMNQLAKAGHENDFDNQDVWQRLLAFGFLKPVETNNESPLYKLQYDVMDCYLKQSTNDHSHFVGLFKSAHPSETIHKAYMEMIRAERAYKEKVASADRMRMKLEENLFDCLNEMEQWEKKRMIVLKEVFHSMMTTFSSSISIMSQTYNQMSLFQETLNAEKDISYIVQQYKTGPFCPKPFVFENFFDEQTSDQIFGIPIEKAAEFQKAFVPPIISCTLQLIQQDIEALPFDDRAERIKTVWCQAKDIKSMNQICKELNHLSSIEELAKALESYDACTLANIIRIYLLELPECLLTFDFYETVKILYSVQQHDEKSRIISIAKLLSTLPSTNYQTIKAFCLHLSRLLPYQSSEEFLQTILYLFSHVLLRPRIYLSTNVHDHHPKRLLRDLLLSFDKVFSAETDKSQEQNVSRLTIAADTYFIQNPVSSLPPLPPKDTHLNSFHLSRPSDTRVRFNYNSTGIPIVPHSSVTLFQDPEHSQATTPNHQTFMIEDDSSLNPDRLSTDISFVLDSDDSDDSSQTKPTEHDNFSTKDILDNIDLQDNYSYS
ncbi:hypothetical protein BD560DRAFT_355436 [Blakeslea trispora]|nr:hypothetical protein BD560DRAFT_355436 [Blakeslea trispora]